MASKALISSRVRMNNRTEYMAGKALQRNVDDAVKVVGGRGSKAYQAAKDFGPVARAHGEDLAKGVKGPLARMRAGRYNRVMTRVEEAAGGAGTPRANTLLKAGLRGMLSPAGVAEEVVGRTMQNMGVDKEPMYEKMKARTRLTRPTRKTY